MNGDRFGRLMKKHYFLQPGFIYVTSRPTVISTVLGSCVSLCIFDQKRNVGGMNHYQLPITRDRKEATARYGNVAVVTLIRMMLQEGCEIENLEAQIYGGAHNPEISPKDVGSENIKIARLLLARKKIRIVSEDVGGDKGRKLVFDIAENEIAVLKVDKLRKGDWYPYRPVR